MLNISLLTYDGLATIGQGNEAKLYVHEAIREDAHLLYGFSTKKEREAFLLLISVSGVGPNIARMIMSSMNVEDFSRAIAGNNVALFKSVKGVGAKTAQRIIVDLKDKIKLADDTLLDKTDLASGETFDEALAALVMLGFTQQASQKALKSLFSSNPALTVEQAIKQALKLM
jgi:Holliday junction DNA helicase RuvA